MKTDIKSWRVTGPIPTRTADAEATVHSPSRNQAASLKTAAGAEPSDLSAFKECQDLCRTRLTEPQLKLFAQLTGLRLHVLWHRSVDFQGSGAMPVLCPKVRQRVGAKDRPPNPDIRCRGCLQRQWKPTLTPANQGRQFIGQCGVTNFCAHVQADKFCPLTLVLQAKVASCSIRTCSPTMNPVGTRCARPGRPQVGPTPPASWKGKPVSRVAFHHAVALARLLLHDLESAAQARMIASRLENALQKLNRCSGALRAPLGGRFAGKLRRSQTAATNENEFCRGPGLGYHARKLVEAMRDYVHQHYDRPINLKELASAMKMNASYLSALFSQATGVTFHQFLEEVRLSKAKALLHDPRNRVGEAALAAGYASPDAFRHAFKAHEGLSPEAWRAHGA